MDASAGEQTRNHDNRNYILWCAIYFIVHARFGKFLDASADFDAQTQERKQDTVLIETIFCGLYNLNLVSLVSHTCFPYSSL